MAINPYEEIISLLRKNKAKFEQLEHDPVYTSEQAAAVRGLKLEQGAKSLLFKAGDEFVLVVLSGDKKADWSKLKNTLHVKQIRMATPDEVVEKMGVEVGACYPFGNVAGLRTIVDNSLAKQEIISCNPGKHDTSLKFKFEDYRNIVRPEIAEVSS